jgi:hypothetical protein
MVRALLVGMLREREHGGASGNPPVPSAVTANVCPVSFDAVVSLDGGSRLPSSCQSAPPR